jgi:hypothetical protein
MNLSKRKIFVSLVLLGITIGTTDIAFGVGKASLSRVGARLSTETDTIRVGDPLVCTLTYLYETDSNAPPNEVLHRARVDILDSNDHPVGKGHFVFPSLVLRGRKEGLLAYSGNFSLFWNFRTKEGLIFDEPGRYRIVLPREADLDEESCKPLITVVKPASRAGLQALALLSDPNDYAFLELGAHDYPERRPERIANLSRVADKHPHSVLGKWCASRLGVEYFEDFHQKHPSFQEFKAKYRDGKIEEPLFDRAWMYLDMGTGLRDEFTIRENVLYLLSTAEIIKGNYKKAGSLLDELAAKYPHGEYGKRATRAKAELLSIKKEEGKRPGSGTRGSFLIVIIVIACLVVGVLGFLLRSRLSRRSK